MLMDRRLDPPIERRKRGVGLGKSPRELDFEFGTVPAGPGCDASQDVTRPKKHREPIRIVQDDRVIDTQTAATGHRPARHHRSPTDFGVHDRNASGAVRV